MATTYAIPDGRLAFDVVKTTAAVSTGATVSGLSFSPGLLWRKNRDNVESHYLVDSVRGTSTGGYLSSNSTAAAAGYPGGDGTLTFNSDGYTITETNWNAGEFYFNGRSYVDWLWKAGGTPASNTAGSITSSVSANTTAGFSVVTYTGTGANATVGHGLGVAPGMVIVKARSATTPWYILHGTRAAGYISLNSTAARAADPLMWGSAEPTSSVFGVGVIGYSVNDTAATYVAYAFAEIPGFSKIGSYVGNGSVDGPFVYLGFRPRYIMYKRTNIAGTSWGIMDSSRNTYNLANASLYANISDAEYTSLGSLDFLSNGFKIRSSDVNINSSGDTYIYMAFAENPTKFANAR